MLDTTVFNWLLDGHIRADQLPKGAAYFVTHIQRDELAAESREERRKQLFAQLGALKPISMPTESGIIGVSRIGEFKFSDGSDYTTLLAALNAKKKSKNNSNDALIAETALKNKLTLISADTGLCEVAGAAGVSVIHFKR